MIPYEYDPYAGDEHQREDLLAERRCQQRYRAQLARHPDPRDPDYPGDDNLSWDD